MLPALTALLFPKQCWHIVRVPTYFPKTTPLMTNLMGGVHIFLGQAWVTAQLIWAQDLKSVYLQALWVFVGV